MPLHALKISQRVFLLHALTLEIIIGKIIFVFTCNSQRTCNLLSRISLQLLLALAGVWDVVELVCKIKFKINKHTLKHPLKVILLLPRFD